MHFKHLHGTCNKNYLHKFVKKPIKMGLALIIHEKAKIQQAVEICETGHTCRFLTMGEMEGSS